MIWFNGRSSDDFRLIVQRYPDVILPTRKNEKVSVPGRNGDILIQQDAFENVTQRYEFYISAEQTKLTPITHKVAEWLCVKGYQKLEDSYFLDTFRLAAFNGGLEISNILNRFGRATIEFDCKPQRFYKFGDFFLDVANGGKLQNPSPFTAKPILIVSGSGAATITINGKTLALTDCNGITIDCEIMQAYKDGISKNGTVSGDFFELPQGESEITWTGGITAIQIKPRWFTI